MPPRKRKAPAPADTPGPQRTTGVHDASDDPPHRGGTRESPTASSGHNLRIGPAGWSYPDWAGYVYPSRRPRNFHEAAYLSEYDHPAGPMRRLWPDEAVGDS